MNVSISFNIDVVLLLIFITIIIGAIILGERGWFDGLKRRILAV